MNPEIFKYTNYRLFLSDYYELKKEKNKNFSYQQFANKAGFKTKTFLYQVIKGIKPLSKSSLFNLSQGMNLNRKESEYFENLVFFNQAKTGKEKEYYFNNLQNFNNNSSAKLIRENQFEFYSKWYQLAVREIIQLQNFSGDYNKLAKSVYPAITPGQAKKSVKLLLELGFLKKLASNKFVQTEAHLTTGDEVAALAIQNYHKENLELAKNAIDKVPVSSRDISSLTLGVSEEGFLKLKNELQIFRKKIIKIVESDESPDRVYQAGFQLFPLSLYGKKGVK